MYERFTDRARSVMHLTNGESERLHLEYIGTEHLLLLLLRVGTALAARVLAAAGMTVDQVRQETINLLGRGISGTP